MRAVFACLLVLSSGSIRADEATADQQSAALEKKLGSIEFRTEKFISGREKMIKGIAELQPALRKMSCQAYPVRTNKETLEIIRREIAELDQNSSQLSADQLSRLAAQKQIVSQLKPDIDCSAL
jgi:hypothetical protein